jgi:hypothetical protein
MAADTSWATSGNSSELPVAREQDGGTRAELMDASDHAPTGALFPLDGEREALQHEVHSAARGTGRNAYDESASDDVAEPGDLMSRQDKNSQNLTNDPNLSHVARISEHVLKSEFGQKMPAISDLTTWPDLRERTNSRRPCFRLSLPVERPLLSRQAGQ